MNDAFWFWVMIAAWFCAGAGLTYTGRWRGVLTLLAGVLLYSLWRLTDQGLGQAEIIEDIAHVSYVGRSGLAGAAFGWATSRMQLGLIWIAAPVLAGLAWKFEEQRIPSSSCTEVGIEVRVNQVPIFVPWGVWARLNWEDNQTHLVYSADRNDKPFVKKVCANTDGGESPIFVSSVDISPAWMRGLCSASQDLPGCTGFTRWSTVQHVQIVPRDTRQNSALENSETWGTSDTGGACFEDDLDLAITHCRGWAPLGPEQSVIVDAQDFTTSAELKARISTAIEELKKLLHVRGGS